MISWEHKDISVYRLAPRQGTPFRFPLWRSMIAPPEHDLQGLRAGAVPRCGRVGAEDTTGPSRALGRHEKVSHFCKANFLVTTSLRHLRELLVHFLSVPGLQEGNHPEIMRL